MYDSHILAAIFPEVLLSAVALILMLVAAYAGDKSIRLINWIAVFALVLAGGRGGHH